MTIEQWLAAACADADARGLADLKPLLASLADATNALRDAGWERAALVQPEAGAPEAPAPAPPPADGTAR